MRQVPPTPTLTWMVVGPLNPPPPPAPCTVPPGGPSLAPNVHGTKGAEAEESVLQLQCSCSGEVKFGCLRIVPRGVGGRDALDGTGREGKGLEWKGLEGKGPQKRSLKRLDRRLKEVAKAVGGGYCRLQMPLRLAPAVRETVAGHRLGALEGGGVPHFQCISGGEGGAFGDRSS